MQVIELAELYIKILDDLSSYIRLAYPGLTEDEIKHYARQMIKRAAQIVDDRYKIL